MQLHEAFLWSAQRTVTKTATVSLHGNIYQVDPALVGRKVELVFDPFDLSGVDVRHGGHWHGPAAGFSLGRHAHPKARTETAETEPVPATGIDYLRLVEAAHDGRLGNRINFHALANPDIATTVATEAAETANPSTDTTTETS